MDIIILNETRDAAIHLTLECNGRPPTIDITSLWFGLAYCTFLAFAQTFHFQSCDKVEGAFVIKRSVSIISIYVEKNKKIEKMRKREGERTPPERRRRQNLPLVKKALLPSPHLLPSPAPLTPG